MTSPTPKAPLPTCPPTQIGPCANCQQLTHRYGYGRCPLCPVCLPEAEARQKKS